jgi:uncharacterized protein YcfJ
MKQSILFAALGLVAVGAGAQEVGRVLSSTPVIQQVAVPRTYCNQPAYAPQPQTSGAGGLIGAITGGAIGSQIGHGGGTAAAMAVGVIGGALLGNNIEANNARQAYAQPACGTETTYENRTVGYDVTYEYAGQRHTTRLPYDPGARLALDIRPADARQASYDAAPVERWERRDGAPVPARYADVELPPAYESYDAYPAYPVYQRAPQRIVYAAPAAVVGYPVVAAPAISLSFSSGSWGHRSHGPRYRYRDRHWR